MPVPVVFGIWICSPRQQRTAGRDVSYCPPRLVVLQAGVTDVEKRLPILNSTRLRRAFGIFLQVFFYRAGGAEH